ncbi:hypothetical protein [Anaeromicropila herbilytica]|uniref:N-acetyltransferase domain-containing protein n=1 Tax=Anaeromicropila herbilytica TaxID=2785025 RepID=A0A7R7ICW9_9FIRM|nr:hypothetical protein [Anaeromicropila herbilytica]BCN30291.1 hypothetical protein bsdtb5_15860 [Anaeromicropila herbilytica]
MIDIYMDAFTPCLLDRETNEFVDTTYSIIDKSEIPCLTKKGFLMEWNSWFIKRKEIYQLNLKDDDNIQGLIALEKRSAEMAVHINLMESAPHNQGKNKKYLGVGGHLFAIAIEQSIQLGFDGFIYFEAKNMELIKHYHESFGAELIGIGHPYRMVLDEVKSKILLEKYTLLRRG